MHRVIHFEIPAKKPEQMAEFYIKVLDWKIEKWDGPVPYWLVSTGPRETVGIDGEITPVETRPAPGVLITAEVESIEKTLDKIKAAGGSVVTKKKAIPGIGWHAYFRDPEGNVIGILQSDPDAK